MGLTKMKIGEFEVQVNPKEVKYDRSIVFAEDKTVGANKDSPKFNKYGPEKITFDLTFDGTGVVPPKDFNPSAAATDYTKGMASVSDPADDIIEYLEEFEKVVFDFSGEEHAPKEVAIKWGSLHIEHCYVETYNITFSLFSPDGKPIRAVVSLGFRCSMDQIKRAKEANKSSPDLTHLKTIRTGDELFIMCHQVYNSPKYYLQVAEKNNILNFRKLKSGNKILFPPLEK